MAKIPFIIHEKSALADDAHLNFSAGKASLRSPDTKLEPEYVWFCTML